MTPKYEPPSYETCCGDSDEEAEFASSLTAKEYANGVDKIPEPRIVEFISEGELNQGLNNWLPRPGDPVAPRKMLRDSIFQPVSELLLLYGKGEWSLRPRTFAVLRTLGCTKLLDSFVQECLMDSALPYNESTLPAFIKGSELRSKFLRHQPMVLYKEKGVAAMEDGGRHLHLAGMGDDYFKSIKTLGYGRFGTVDEVFSRNTGRLYARKRIVRGYSALADERVLKQFESEIQALKRLWHPHIVKLKGSYTDSKFLGIIMTPVAKMNLDEYLKEPMADENLRGRCLRSFSGCLATALAYLHQQNVRHNDVKPQNILVADSQVYLSDFGTSRAWGTEDRSTTQGKHEGFTPRYSAPETHDTGARNTAADVWSLGCVFLEMATVTQRQSVADMYAFFEDNGTGRVDAIWANHPAAKLWLTKLARGLSSHDEIFVSLISTMLQTSPDSRPTAAQIRGTLMDEGNAGSYICPQCASPDGLSPVQQPRRTESEQNHSVVIPKLQDNAVTATFLNLPERDIQKVSKRQDDEGKSEQRLTTASCLEVDETAVSRPKSTTRARPTSVRFAGLPEDIRPLPSDQRPIALDEDDSFIRPEPVKPPSLRRKDSMPLPKATLVPSYVLAGTNHFSRYELAKETRTSLPESNLFVYGRLMFPGVLNAIAMESTQGVYSDMLQRRLHPSSADWAKADLSIKHATEAMTPARLRGYDRWRPRGLNCAVIQDARLTKKNHAT